MNKVIKDKTKNIITENKTILVLKILLAKIRTPQMNLPTGYIQVGTESVARKIKNVSRSTENKGKEQKSIRDRSSNEEF